MSRPWAGSEAHSYRLASVMAREHGARAARAARGGTLAAAAPAPPWPLLAKNPRGALTILFVPLMFFSFRSLRGVLREAS